MPTTNSYAFQIIDVLGATSGTQIRGINDGAGTPAELSGSYTLTSPNFPYAQGFTMIGGSAFTFGPNGQPYGQHNDAYRLNNDGQVAGQSGHFFNTQRGYIYTPGSGGRYTTISANSNQNETVTWAGDLNDRQMVVGSVQLPSGTVGFEWQNGSMTKLLQDPHATSPGSSTVATGDNDGGQVVGFYNLGWPNGYVNNVLQDHGFIWRNGHYTTVDVPGATSTDLEDINDEEEAVGTYRSADGHYHGFVYQVGSGKMTFINAPGATDTWIAASNDEHQVAGYYATSDGIPHGFVATPGNGSNLASLAEMAPLPAVVKQLTGDTVGHAYFDPSLPVTVVAVAHS